MTNSSLKQDALGVFQKAINYKFKNINLLQNALTHKSYASEHTQNSNERLEFLGDSVLSACVAGYLYNAYPHNEEGKLSKLKAQVVSSQNLFLWAESLNLEAVIRLGKAESRSASRLKEAIICDAFEAVIGAIFLDGGYDSATRFIISLLETQSDFENQDHKSALQEVLQKHYKTLPVYKLVKEHGPDHEKKFEVGVYLKNRLLGSGSGFSKKEAQIVAAKEALNNLKSTKMGE
ncbi:MAG: ribonuclease III [Elusimicrobia bacterium]|nr:ribonuclease III [Elusimicrobiota bacterium]